MNIRDSQNFLHNKKLVKDLVEQSNLTNQDIVLEIGPGKGIITKELLSACKEVYAIEFDKGLFDKLSSDLRDQRNLHLINDDFLLYDLPKDTYKVFSNIPFNITADILSKLLMNDNPPSDMYLIMQYEAVLKYAGEPYYSDSLKSLMFKPQYEIKIVHEFNATDFAPVPKVSIVLAHFHKKEWCDVKKATMREWWDFLSYVYTAPGKFFKEKTKKIFSYEQQKRLRKSLHIEEDVSISCWTYTQWIGLFNCYIQLVCAEKKSQVIGSYERLLRQQENIEKVHRNRRK